MLLFMAEKDQTFALPDILMWFLLVMKKNGIQNRLLQLVKNGILYGRGASDMKTAIAAFLVSSNKFLNSK